MIKVIKAELYKCLHSIEIKVVYILSVLYMTMYGIDLMGKLMTILNVGNSEKNINVSTVFTDSGFESLLMFMLPVIILVVFTEDYCANKILRYYDSLKSRIHIFLGKCFVYLLLVTTLVIGVGTYEIVLCKIYNNIPYSSLQIYDYFIEMLCLVFAYIAYGSMLILISTLFQNKVIVVIFCFMYSIIDSIIYSILHSIDNACVAKLCSLFSTDYMARCTLINGENIRRNLSFFLITISVYIFFITITGVIEKRRSYL